MTMPAVISVCPIPRSAVRSSFTGAPPGGAPRPARRRAVYAEPGATTRCPTAVSLAILCATPSTGRCCAQVAGPQEGGLHAAAHPVAEEANERTVGGTDDGRPFPDRHRLAGHLLHQRRRHAWLACSGELEPPDRLRVHRRRFRARDPMAVGQ